jgi:5-deoxy-glucuronate isomerase
VSSPTHSGHPSSDGPTLADTLYRVPRAEGLHLIQRRGNGARELTTHRLTLAAGGTADFSLPGEETVVVLQHGSGRFTCAGQAWDVSRADVFSESATALLVPPGERLRVTATTALEAVLVSTPAPGHGTPLLRTAADIPVQHRGKPGYERDVRDIFAGDAHAQRLVVGETINAPGNWSSYPPHKHDGRNGEPVFEEVYYYRLDPPGGFGLQALYTADGEQATHQVHDGDLVLLPYGYHPVAAPPRYTLYYLWAIVGDTRKLAIFEDPDYAWVHAADS